jgi:hypothetical protein
MWQEMTVGQLIERAHEIVLQVDTTTEDFLKAEVIHRFDGDNSREYTFEFIGLRTKTKQTLMITVGGYEGSLECSALQIVVQDMLEYLCCEWCGDDAAVTSVTISANPRGNYTIVGQLGELM